MKFKTNFVRTSFFKISAETVLLIIIFFLILILKCYVAEPLKKCSEKNPVRMHQLVKNLTQRVCSYSLYLETLDDAITKVYRFTRYIFIFLFTIKNWILCTHRSPLTKLTQGKNWYIHSNFLDDNFEYFRLSTARDDKNNQNCPSSFLNFGLKCC